MTTIVLADDHPMVLHGLRTVLSAVPNFVVVGESATGAETLELVKQLEPDILILDVMLPDSTGIEITQKVYSLSVKTHIVIFSIHSSDAYVRATLTHGASAYILKSADSEEIIFAIHEVLAGRRYLSKTLTSHAVDIYLQAPSEYHPSTAKMLTHRENQVFELVAQGLSNLEIADRLAISPRTVETHRSNLMRKLSLKNHAELLRYAISHHLLLDDSQR